MAAIGGDTVVPTNWSGLIGVAVLVGAIAAATYFGLSMSEGDKNVEQDDGLTVQEVFSSSARREVAAAEPVRALSRADFVAPAARSSASAATDDDDAGEDASADDWDSAADDTEAMAQDDADAREASAAAVKPAPSPRPAPLPTTAPRESAASRPATASGSSPATREREPAIVDARTRPAAEALVAWWKEAGNGLEVRFAGTLDRGGKVSDGIAVMFGEAVAPAQADQYLQLTDASGKVVPGRWKMGANPTLLMMDGLPQGRYKLTIGAGLPGESGKTLANTVSGPIFVY